MSALGAEWMKFRTVRGWMIGLLLAGLMIVLFTFLQANGKHEGSCTSPNPDSCSAGHPFVPTGPGGEAVADTFRFLARPMSGNATVTAQLTSLTGRIWAGPADEAPSPAHTRPGVSAWAKVGLLITPSTAQGSPYAAVMATGSHGVRFQYDYTHDSPGLPGSIGPAAPRWLRLIRAGDTITGYDSRDGTRWRRIGSAALPGLPSRVDVGLFATSPVTERGSATEATARFDDVALGSRSGGSAATGSGGWLDRSIGTGPGDFYTTLGSGGAAGSGGSFTLSGSGDIAPAVPLQGGDTASDSLLFGLVVAMIVLIVTATMFITGEYRRGLIRTTFAATPHRGRVLAAKALVVGIGAFAVGAVAAAAAIPLAEHVLNRNGDYIFPTGPLAVARTIAGSGALVALTAVAALGIGTILRRGAATVLVSIVVFALPAFFGPGIVGPSSSAASWLFRLTPAAAFSVLGLLPRSPLVSYPYTMANGYYPLSPLAGLLVLAAYAAVALALARLTLIRRDA